jgi:glycosyltransferase involved in cell wall biosynthesis
VSGVHQFVPVLHRGDAVGRHTLRLRDATRSRGIGSDIYVGTTDGDTADETIPVAEYARAARPGDVVVYQFATSSFMAPWLAGRSETLVVNYHNVTPPEFVSPWDPHLALGQARAQGDLRLLAPRTALAVADSAYNETHLAAAGFASTAVIPPSAAVDRTTGARETLARSSQPPDAPNGGLWLAVGRVSPNKAIEHTIAALAVTREHGDPAATLHIIGKPDPRDYERALHRYVAVLGLSGAVTFAGHVSDASVASAYATADVLVVTSDHEGFCVPVVEAMSAGLPVVAFDQGAIAEVMGDGGLLVSSRNPYDLAAAIRSLLTEPPRREALVAAGRRRIAALGLDGAADRLAGLTCALLDRPGPSQ